MKTKQDLEKIIQELGTVNNEESESESEKNNHGDIKLNEGNEGVLENLKSLMYILTSGTESIRNILMILNLFNNSSWIPSVLQAYRSESGFEGGKYLNLNIADKNSEKKYEERRESARLIMHVSKQGIYGIDDVYSHASKIVQSEGKILKNANVSFIDIPYNDREKIKSELENRLKKKNITGNIYLEKKYWIPEKEKPKRITELGQMWNLENIQAYLGRDLSKGSNVKVGIIDTGVDYEHNELAKNFDESDIGYNFVDDNDFPYDYNTHGTHVAGTVAGTNVGVAPEVQLYALKVLGDDGYGSETDVLSAVDWAIEHNLDIVNMSLGSNYPSPAEEEMCNAAYKNGLIIVAAAGNDGNVQYNYPASYPTVVSVAAVDKNNSRADFSNMNDMLDISAPGVRIKSSVPGGYAYYSGTSMATPHITGVLALAKSYYKQNLSVNRIFEDALEKSALDLGVFDKYGHGLAQAYNMLKRLE